MGDTVDVPGGMHGTIKFIGPVKGKAGLFAGVELAKEWAARGKNDGDVDGYACKVVAGTGLTVEKYSIFYDITQRRGDLSPIQQGLQKVIAYDIFG